LYQTEAWQAVALPYDGRTGTNNAASEKWTAVYRPDFVLVKTTIFGSNGSDYSPGIHLFVR
jgi:hypothetical protein